MPLGVKAYLRKKVGANADQKYEIRRFTVDEEVASSYDYLVAKIEAVFPTVNGQSVRLYWKGSRYGICKRSRLFKMFITFKNKLQITKEMK